MTSSLNHRRPSRLLTANEAEICLELWATKRFDTFDIARLLCVGEDAVARTIQAARDIARQMRAHTPARGEA
ncbi:hypothetical protein [Mycoplana rhizolycopersici]|uniref:Uncharacterized protein n=1 Tax=Mycoplana rhizolycopersici TaxID=2746702 RepID=A0ABX2QIA4_9HYPH|nr:hypothetical protein [Rhizobium rhizolycopersici]NVP56069.1 hypothetical protein [Rhizobium rhizolycopersici]